MPGGSSGRLRRRSVSRATREDWHLTEVVGKPAVPESHAPRVPRSRPEATERPPTPTHRFLTMCVSRPTRARDVVGFRVPPCRQRASRADVRLTSPRSAATSMASNELSTRASRHPQTDRWPTPPSRLARRMTPVPGPMLPRATRGERQYQIANDSTAPAPHGQPPQHPAPQQNGIEGGCQASAGLVPSAGGGRVARGACAIRASLSSEMGRRH